MHVRRAAEDAHNDVAAPAPQRADEGARYGKATYAHNEVDAIADMSCLPPELAGKKYYDPKERGFEKEIKRRLDGWAEIKKQRSSKTNE